MEKLAVIKTGGKQYIVSEGDSIDIEKLEGQEGDEVVFDQVLLLKNGQLKIGQPNVENVTVTGQIKRQYKDSKKIVFKYKNKTRQEKLRGHRQPMTQVEIKTIVAK